jgi:hypothetical protein
MTITVTPEEIAQFRVDLADYPDALTALNEIEDCEGDLEDASIALAIQVGQEPDTNDRWIESVAKQWRHILCRADHKEALEDGLTGNLLLSLTEHTMLPLKLATPVAIFAIKTGMQDFCRSFEAKIQ